MNWELTKVTIQVVTRDIPLPPQAEKIGAIIVLDEGECRALLQVKLARKQSGPLRTFQLNSDNTITLNRPATKDTQFWVVYATSRKTEETKLGPAATRFACPHCNEPYVKDESNGREIGWYTCHHAPNCPAEHLKAKDH